MGQHHRLPHRRTATYATRTACRADATSQRMRNFSMSLEFADESWRYILLPLYLATYNYENKAYQVMVNGQNGIIAGQRPVAWKKVIGAMVLSLLPSFILGLIALLFSVPAAGGLAMVTMMAAMVFIGITLNKASKMGKA